MYILQSIIVLALVTGAFYLTFSAFREIWAMINSGTSEHLTDRPKDRIKSVIRLVFGHKKVLEDPTYGFMHFFYLYGLLVLSIGHFELIFYGLSRFVETFDGTPILYRNFLPMPAVHFYELSQDFFAASVLMVVSVALYKRLSGSVPRLLPRSKDAEIILWFIGALYVSFFLLLGTDTYLRVRDGDLLPGWHWYLPISSVIAMAIKDGPETLLAGVNGISWWLHLGVFLSFAAYIPRSKHMHLVAAGPNIYFRHFDAVAKPRTIDFTKAEKFGADKVQELSWKSILDTFACTECGRCDAVCPANLTQKPLQPKKVLKDLKLNLRYKNWPDLDNPKVPLIAREEITDGQYPSGQVHLDELWACTTCAACVEVCPVLIDSVPGSLMEMRRNLVLMEAKDYPKELNAAMKGMEIQGNPWGVGQSKRIEWTNALNVPLISEQDREVEYLFWVGCAGATDDRAKKIQQALVRILKQSKVDFAILGCEEKCTGDPARRMGNEYVFDSLARDNIETLNKYKFKKIFTTCPHCFNSIKNEYRDFGANFTVQHHTELLAELMKDKRIPLDHKKAITETITFHDPCYLGRYNNQYDAPREALASLPGVTLKEMSFNKKKSFCCGAGGGRMFMEETIGKRINHERTDQAIATGATTVATGCPFCMTMMSDGVADKNHAETMRVRDIAELVAERLAE